MVFATTLTVTAIKPRLFAEKGANSLFLQKEACKNVQIRNKKTKTSKVAA